MKITVKKILTKNPGCCHRGTTNPAREEKDSKEYLANTVHRNSTPPFISKAVIRDYSLQR